MGGLEQVLEELDIVSRFADKVYAVIPDALRLSGQQRNTLDKKAIFLEKHRLVEIYGEQFVTGISVKEENNEIKKIPVSGVFIYLKGNQPAADFFKEEIDRGADGCLSVNPQTMETSIEGVYAAGDVTCKRFRQAVIASAEGCKAALSAERFLSKRTKPRNVWH